MVLAFRSDELLDVDCMVVEERLCHVVHIVLKFGLDEIMGNHRVEELTGEVNAIVAHDFNIIFDVLSDLHDFLVFKNRTEQLDDFLRLFTILRNTHIKCLFFLHSETEPH